MKSALLTSLLALAATAQAETNPFFVFDNGLRIALYPHVNAWLHRIEDALRVVKKVNRQNVGFSGPVGLQCFNLKGDPRVVLAGSMKAWRKLSGALPSPPATKTLP